jgi:hypothetical protein
MEPVACNCRVQPENRHSRHLRRIGALAIVYVIGSAPCHDRAHGPLDHFATGAMANFRTVSEAPAQPLNPLHHC